MPTQRSLLVDIDDFPVGNDEVIALAVCLVVTLVEAEAGGVGGEVAGPVGGVPPRGRHALRRR